MIISIGLVSRHSISTFLRVHKNTRLQHQLRPSKLCTALKKRWTCVDWQSRAAATACEECGALGKRTAGSDMETNKTNKAFCSRRRLSDGCWLCYHGDNEWLKNDTFIGRTCTAMTSTKDGTVNQRLWTNKQRILIGRHPRTASWKITANSNFQSQKP